ncbi:MAG: hypothetical protein R6V31_10110 [Halohasta sp.]
MLSGETEPDAAGSEPTASQPTAAEPNPPPSPTDRVDESAAGVDSAADGVLADAMGGDSTTTERTGHAVEAVDEPPTAPDPTPAEVGSTDRSPDEIPPPEAEQESEAVFEPSTDGGTTTEVPTGASATDGPGGQPTTDQPATTPAAGDDPASTAGSDTESAAEGDDEDRTTLRITKHVGEIFCVDGREYTLRSEDVVTLPTANAEPLVDRDAAMRLD